MQTVDNADALLEFARALALEAGQLIRQAFDQPDKPVQIKPNGSTVTATDQAVNDLVIKRITERFPEHGVLAEEGSLHADCPNLWVCDPIDGTNSFIVGQPTAMFSLAYVVDGQPVLAVAYDPFLDRLLRAVKGGGAFINDKPMHVSQRELQGGILVASNSYSEVVRTQGFFDDVTSQGMKVRLMGGGVFKAALIGLGFVEAWAFPGRSAHDIAAMQLIVEEAGGKVTDIEGRLQRYDGPIRGAIVTNGRMHDAIVAAVQRFGVEDFLGF